MNPPPWYEIPLYVRGSCTLKTYYRILSALDDADISVDYAETEYGDDGAHIMTRVPESIGRGIVAIVGRIAEDFGYVSIDYAALSERDDYVGDEVSQ